MRPATVWDDFDSDDGLIRARGWTVLGRLRDRQRRLVEARERAQELRDGTALSHMMTPALLQQQWQDKLSANWRGSYTVLALLFAQPDEPSLKTMDKRGGYFDIRTGDTWDLFFPGYFRSSDETFEEQVGSRRVGNGDLRGWYFDPSSFDQLRQEVESASRGRWQYSGSADLVLVNVYIPDRGNPEVDWESVQSGSLSPEGSTSLQSVVERVSRDFENANEDASYGVGDVTQPRRTPSGDVIQGIARDTVAEIIAAVGLALTGLN
jgi:hypothetical protein